MSDDTGPWRCPVCRGFVTSGDVCIWTKPGSVFEPCPGRRPTRRLRGRELGRGIGNRPRKE